MNKKIVEYGLLLLGLLIMKFLLAWDFRYYQEYMNILLGYDINAYDIYVDILPISWKELEKTRVIYYFFKYTLNIGYWGFFVFHVLFCISFVYITYKLNIKMIYSFLPLVILPIFRFGVWGYGQGGTDSLVFLIMIWTYYFWKIDKRNLYYLFSIIGLFTREFCLYVNLFIIIFTFFQESSPKQIFQSINIQNIRKTINNHYFEIILILCYIPLRFIILYNVNVEYTYFNLLYYNAFIQFISNIGTYFDVILIYSFIWIILLLENKNKYYILILIVIILTLYVGYITEINKLGCLCIIFCLDFDFFQENK